MGKGRLVVLGPKLPPQSTAAILFPAVYGGLQYERASRRIHSPSALSQCCGFGIVYRRYLGTVVSKR